MRRAWLAVRFVAFVVWELVLANLRVAKTVLFVPRDRLAPGIVAVPLDVRRDLEITLLANLVTLTPGTLSLDVSDDRRTLYVHALDAADPARVRADVKGGFERAVRELFA